MNERHGKIRLGDYVLVMALGAIVAMLSPAMANAAGSAKHPAAKKAAHKQPYAYADKQVQEARAAHESQLQISDIALYWAKKYRDKDDQHGALRFFRIAVKTDPENFQAHRIYGDYLQGYLGRSAFAYRQYQKAMEIYQAHPKNYTDHQKHMLERSISILDRDGGSVNPLARHYGFGVPVLSTNLFSVFVGGHVAYQTTPPDNLSQLTVRDQALQNNPSLINSINDDMTRDNEIFDQRYRAFVRPNNPWLPYVQFSYDHSSTHELRFDPNTYGFDDQGGHDATLELGETAPLTSHFDLLGAASIDWRNTSLYENDGAVSSKTLLSNEHQELYNGVLGVENHDGVNETRVTFSGSYGDIHNRYSSKDTSYATGVDLFFDHHLTHSGSEATANERYVGRRSRYVELSFRQFTRNYRSTSSPNSAETEQTLSLTYDELALFRNKLDLLGNYTYTRWSEQNTSEPGVYIFQKLKFQPQYIAVYKDYSNSFTTGLEDLKVAFPISYTYGYLYRHIDAGIAISPRFVLPYVGINADLEATYRRYTHINQNDFAVLFQLTIDSGAVGLHSLHF